LKDDMVGLCWIKNNTTVQCDNDATEQFLHHHEIYNYNLQHLTGLGELTVELLAAGGLVREGLVTVGLVTWGLVTRGLVMRGLETGGLDTGELVVVGLDMTTGELIGELGNISR